ncbi:MAG: hypothetical protein FJX46_06355 [Alphaproteobacteria bacterium]|nr:hypothetical protein [Alphaproteobacteria bacterium]
MLADMLNLVMMVLVAGIGIVAVVLIMQVRTLMHRVTDMGASHTDIHGLAHQLELALKKLDMLALKQSDVSRTTAEARGEIDALKKQVEQLAATIAAQAAAAQAATKQPVAKR